MQIANWIQATFGGGLKCRCISTDASHSGRSYWISKCLCHLLLHSEAHLDCSIEHHNVYQPVKLRCRTPLLLSLSGVMEEFCNATWQHDCLKDQMNNLHFSFFPCWKVTSPAYWRLHRYQQPMQISWWCPDTQIRSDHLQIQLRTVCLKNLIWETNQICLQSEQTLRLELGCQQQPFKCKSYQIHIFVFTTLNFDCCLTDLTLWLHASWTQQHSECLSWMFKLPSSMWTHDTTTVCKWHRDCQLESFLL